MTSKLLSALLLSTILTLQIGCNEDDSSREIRRLDNQLTRLLDQFENAEQEFGPSANSDALVQNAQWLDRMIHYNNEIASIERKAVSLGANPFTELRRELDARIARHRQTIQSDMRYVDDINEEEIARIWLRTLEQ